MDSSETLNIEEIQTLYDEIVEFNRKIESLGDSDDVIRVFEEYIQHEFFLTEIAIRRVKLVQAIPFLINRIRELEKIGEN